MTTGGGHMTVTLHHWYKFTPEVRVKKVKLTDKKY